MAVLAVKRLALGAWRASAAMQVLAGPAALVRLDRLALRGSMADAAAMVALAAQGGSAALVQ